ncbi:MAG: helix-turn-helix transcriptional regulator [Gemmatimonadetes bacterium]|nr:helix-turn-helix transcriptional regulator [Gemmatimonadota bacterium]
MSSESLAVKLRQARGALSLAEAEARSGVPADRIRMYEEGERQPYGKTLERLAYAYGLPLAELRGAVGEAALPPAPRRRRRRMRGDTIGRAFEVPLEVAEGQTIRVVLELIIRPKAPMHAAEPTAAAGAAASASGSTTPSSQAAAGFPTRLARERAPLPARPPEPRDPLSEMRRAYRSFREQKP